MSSIPYDKQKANGEHSPNSELRITILVLKLLIITSFHFYGLNLLYRSICEWVQSLSTKPTKLVFCILNKSTSVHLSNDKGLKED